jgi:3',5'-cyclic AMP phosphodiesterase CpdA
MGEELAGGQVKRRVLRLAHLTDVHLTHDRRAPDGLAACLRHVQSQADRPDLILQGGDAIMDGLPADQASAQGQFDLWQSIVRAELDSRLPMVNCLGNHDVWGWDRLKSGCRGDEPHYGKAWAMQVMGLTQRYYSFNRAGWHFVVLDSTFNVGNDYTAKLDDEQFEWLDADLAANKGAPVLVLSHIPILSVSAFLDGDNESSGNWQVPGAWMHIDARRIKDLFVRRRNVRLCLSGHLHMVDRCDYLGVSYLCSGAVSGAWWKGSWEGFEPGYALVDLFDDGSFSAQYTGFGWLATP